MRMVTGNVYCCASCQPDCKSSTCFIPDYSNIYSMLVMHHTLRAVPTWPISRRQTLIIGRLQSADFSGFKILNMFDRESRPTMRESVVKSADSAVESADYWSRPTGNWPSGYGPLEYCLLRHSMSYYLYLADINMCQ